ncbi:MAG: 30S ribosomal protein S6 [Candidatus Liptonbacteria bacterium]|nr:30S ribosomal protein S6 [Candidatus Liptonbacteria bacterium]
MLEETNDRKSYEIAFLVRSEEDAQQVIKLLKAAGAEVALEGAISKLNLAYPIKKEHSAHFGYFHFLLETEKVKQLEDSVRINSLILRSLIITPPFVKNKARSFLPSRRRPPVFSQPAERKTQSLSNEALEKQLKEILQ